MSGPEIQPLKPSDLQKAIYVVERRPPSQPSHGWPFLEKVKQVAGVAIAFFGLALLSFAAASLAGYVIGLVSLTASRFEMAFVIGLIATVAGFNLATKSQGAEVYLGPLSITV